MVVFFVGLYLLTGFNGLGYNLPVNIYVPVAIGLLFIIIGHYLKEIKTNWFIGIRTPWTMSSEKVWAKTHNFGGKVFMLIGLLLAIMPCWPSDWQLPIFLVLICLMLLGTVGYSYMVYRQEEKGRKNK